MTCPNCERLRQRLAEVEWFLSPRPMPTRIHADGSCELPREVVERVLSNARQTHDVGAGRIEATETARGCGVGFDANGSPVEPEPKPERWAEGSD